MSSGAIQEAVGPNDASSASTITNNAYTDEDLQEILELENCKRVHFGSAISDMLGLSNAKILISSASTFSMWASFLGQHPTIWFPGQMRQKLINDATIFEGEMDYNDPLPITIIQLINND